MTIKDSWKPLETIEVSIRLWWILFVFMVLGGGAGFLIFSMTPPTYESQAEFTFLIDYTKTEKLTDIEADQANVTAGDVFLSTKVVDAVVQEAGLREIPIAQDEFRRDAFVEHTNSEWTLRLRSNNAKTATVLVNIWADQSLLVLKEGLGHALLSNYYHEQLDNLVHCVEQVTGVEPAAPICGFNSINELQQSVEKVSTLEKQESDQSLGIISSLAITLNRRAESPGQIVIEGRSIFILIGVLLGLLFFLLFEGVLLKIIEKIRPHD